MPIKTAILNKYYAYFWMGYKSLAVYKWEAIYGVIINCAILIFQYYLWQAIFASHIEGSMPFTFAQTYTYIAMSLITLSLFNTNILDAMSYEIISGNIVRDIVRPLTYHITMTFDAAGGGFFRLLIFLLPGLLMIKFLLWPLSIPMHNLAPFILSFFLAFFIITQIDLLVASLAVFTESVWGLKLTKISVVTILSGALVPLSFLPQSVSQWLMWLPFQCICHTPMSILTDSKLMNSDILGMIFIQIIWFVILGALAHIVCQKIIKNVTVNGG